MRAMRHHFGKTGIERLTAEGASFTQAYYSHATTYTGPRHACIASGAYANKNGFVANKYYDRAAGKVFTMLAEAAHPVLEQKPGAEDDSSPVNFIGETIGDRLRVATGMKAKVVAIATKDRAAVLVKPGVHREWVDISDLAPTLAGLLDIGAPAGADGQAGGGVAVGGHRGPPEYKMG